jgi:hypothetical protein
MLLYLEQKRTMIGLQIPTLFESQSILDSLLSRLMLIKFYFREHLFCARTAP